MKKKYNISLRVRKLLKRYMVKRDIDSAVNIIFDALVNEYGYPLNPLWIRAQLDQCKRIK